MKKFMVTVDGNSYEVEVEEVIDGSTPSNNSGNTEVEEKPVLQTSKKVNTAASTAKKTVPAGATTIKAPMPGTILDIKVNEGDDIKKGQVLCILEAMKMENEIMAPNDGKIASVNTSKGVSVESGDILFSIE